MKIFLHVVSQNFLYVVNQPASVSVIQKAIIIYSEDLRSFKSGFKNNIFLSLLIYSASIIKHQVDSMKDSHEIATSLSQSICKDYVLIKFKY